MFFIVGSALCVVFGPGTSGESDSSMMKVVKGGFNPWSVLWSLTFFTWLNNDAIPAGSKGGMRASVPRYDLYLTYKYGNHYVEKNNGWHLQHIVPIPSEKHIFYTRAIRSAAKPVSGSPMIKACLWRKHAGWDYYLNTRSSVRSPGLYDHHLNEMK